MLLVDWQPGEHLLSLMLRVKHLNNPHWQNTCQPIFGSLTASNTFSGNEAAHNLKRQLTTQQILSLWIKSSKTLLLYSVSNLKPIMKIKRWRTGKHKAAGGRKMQWRCAHKACLLHNVLSHTEQSFLPSYSQQVLLRDSPPWTHPSPYLLKLLLLLLNLLLQRTPGTLCILSMTTQLLSQTLQLLFQGSTLVTNKNVP